DRVAKGGHEVPEDKVRSRFERVWTYVGKALPLADDAFVYDNSRARQPFRVVATFAHGRPLAAPTWPLWTPDALRATAPPCCAGPTSS
ncbi:MAG: hypothetical protein JWO12_2400, partial [Frankiales bacterium]|nr:hypothetical protein [Frankiales bacterium]